jgi:hypothetical protein
MRTAIRSLGAGAIVAVFLVQPLCAADAGWSPTQADIMRLENGLKLPMAPSPSGPLKDYARYYAGIVQNGHRMIRGELVAFDAAQRGHVHITTEDKFPVIMDGGCGVVNLLYDVETGKTVSIGCNGLA